MPTQEFTVDKPITGAGSEITIPEGEITSFAFDSSDIQGLRLSDGGELVITFTDESSTAVSGSNSTSLTTCDFDNSNSSSAILRSMCV